ncbi:hypothetical protein ACWDSJ_00965 [Nocardia sp. NPDC003482]
MTSESPTPQRFSLVPWIIVLVALVLAVATVILLVWQTGTADEPAATGTPSSAEGAPLADGAPSPAETAVAATDFGYQPLWPFDGVDEAVDWQREANPGGHQPWHLDAGATARMFTGDYLGYGDIDKIVKTDVRGDEAWVSVGFDNPNGTTVTAAVVHLVRIGAGADRPWEVVGTEDGTLTLNKPGYGAPVTSPITVGGRITGVDESLRVQIRTQGRAQPLAEASATPAGGTDVPWSATVKFPGGCPGVLTVAVSTGGHVAEVERFAVTGVRC